MALTFLDLQGEVKRRATRDQAGTEFDTETQNAINLSLLRVAREAPWRALRRAGYFTTVDSYTTGSGAASVTASSKSVTVTGATFLTDNVVIGRRIKFSGSSKYFTIRTITGETTLTLDVAFDGTTSTTNTYEILPQEVYNLPVQCNPTRFFMWHNAYGYPYQVQYVTEQDFRKFNITDTNINIPISYRIWGQDTIVEQPLQGSVMRVYSSASGDTSKSITVFGTVSGYPDYEIITTNSSNGTTATSGSKTFTSVDRVTKDSSTTGRITVDANSANTTIAVLPVGDISNTIMYSHVALYPLPNDVYDMNIQYYKDPYFLVNDGDVHELGGEFDEAIILLALTKVRYSQSINEDGDRMIALYQDEIKSLRRTNMDKIDQLEVLKRPSQSGPNNLLAHRNLAYVQLGGMYGPSTR